MDSPSKTTLRPGRARTRSAASSDEDGSRAPGAGTRPRRGWTALARLALLALAACAAPQPSMYVHPNADLALYRRVAVLPLENLTTDRFAGERVREIVTIELSALELFDVAETGEVNRVLRALGPVSLQDLGSDEIARLGEDLGVQALMMGSVMEYRERRTGNISTPEIALSLRLVDVENAITAWSVSDAEAGTSVMTRLFGVGEETLSEAARDLVRELFRSL